MDPYRVLLVDDEEDIRVGISRKMDWAGLGFSLVGEAENGQDALELAEQLRPDVVLTDIKMPFMDGLELCRILTQRLPAAHPKRKNFSARKAKRGHSLLNSLSCGRNQISLRYNCAISSTLVSRGLPGRQASA